MLLCSLSGALLAMYALYSLLVSANINTKNNNVIYEGFKFCFQYKPTPQPRMAVFEDDEKAKVSFGRNFMLF